MFNILLKQLKVIIGFSGLLIATASDNYAHANVTMFPPVGCNSQETKVITWKDNGEATTECLDGDGLLTRLNFPSCKEGQTLVFHQQGGTCAPGRGPVDYSPSATGGFVCEDKVPVFKTQAFSNEYAGQPNTFEFVCPKGSVVSCGAIMSPVGDRQALVGIDGNRCFTSGLTSSGAHVKTMRESIYPSYPTDSKWVISTVCGWNE